MKRVLVVDDYLPFLEEMRNSATDEGISVSIAESSLDAIRMIEQERFDLVVTDLFMETKASADGFAVLKAARGNQFTQVIVITAYGGPQLAIRTMQMGAFDYLERGASGIPFRSMLARKIRLALDYGMAKSTLAEHNLL